MTEGADGVKDANYEYTLVVDGDSGLKGIVGDAAAADITLAANDTGTMVTGSVGSTSIFTVTLNDSGTVTLALTGNGSIAHDDTADADDLSTVLTAINAHLKVTDNDGDVAEHDRALSFQFEDDGPVIADKGTIATLTVDETFASNGSQDSTDTTNAVSSVTSG